MYNTKTEELTIDIIWEDFQSQPRILYGIFIDSFETFYCFIILEKRLTIAWACLKWIIFS